MFFFILGWATFLASLVGTIIHGLLDGVIMSLHGISLGEENEWMDGCEIGNNGIGGCIRADTTFVIKN